jgi:hypothetical protein
MFTRSQRHEAGVFRASIHDSARTFLLKLQGRLDGKEAHEVEWCWATAASTIRARSFVVDLSSVSSVDPVGRDLLVRMYENGAGFIAGSPEMAELVSGITGVRPAEHPDRRDRRNPLRALRDFLILAASLRTRVGASAN